MDVSPEQASDTPFRPPIFALVFLALAILSAAAVIIFATRIWVVSRRRRWLPFVFSTAIVSSLAFFTGVLLRLGLSLGDSVGVVGIPLAFFAGALVDYHRTLSTRTKLIVVIPSKAPFNVALRRGIAAEASGSSLEIDDPCAKIERGYEDLAGLLKEVHEAVNQKPDYLLVHAPSPGVLDASEFQEMARTMTGRHGRILCIEGGPANIADFHGLITEIVSDSQAGAKLLADYAVKILAQDEALGQVDPYVCILSGPRYSPIAVNRVKIMQDTFEDVNIRCSVREATGWSELECHDKTLSLLVASIMHGNPVPDIIICGNDVMALGAVRAIREIGHQTKHRPKVFGYDGLAEAVACIAQPETPFYATIRTPPALLGEKAIQMICEEIDGKRKPAVADKIEIDFTHLVTKENANHILNF